MMRHLGRGNRSEEQNSAYDRLRPHWSFGSGAFSCEAIAPLSRSRWQTLRPGALWHGNVCHGPTLVVGDRRTPVHVHALMDDHARFVVALRVVSTEREQDMLDLLFARTESETALSGQWINVRGDILLVAARQSVLLTGEPGVG